MPLVLEILRNAADILILAFVIYKILILLKDNRAMQLVKGLVLLIIFYYISDWLHLETLHFLLGQSWAVLFIGVLIIFQPELRSLLEHLGGKGALINPTKQGPKERLIQDLLKTITSASASKTGVLIVLEGKTGLKEYIHTGTAVDAAVSSELLGNLFFKNAPLHDGAVILRGGRIMAAGCIMPLTSNPDIDSAFGTRHRAAIGISEVSDGLALVVSEENGGISAAWNGKFYRHITPAAVERLLRDFYSGDRRKKAKGKKKRREAS